VNPKSAYYWRKKILFGGFLIVFGALALLDRLNVLPLGSVVHFWPAIFVLVGMNKLIEFPNPRYVIGGLWSITFGVWLIVSIEHIGGLTFHNSWPFLLIAWGAGMILSFLLKSRYPNYREYCHGR